MALVSVDEYNLVTAHRGGDAQAFADIVRRYHPSLFAHARRRLCDAHAAEDVVQEAFLRAYRSLPAFEGEYRLGAWLHRIVDNVCNDHLDRRRRDDLIRVKLEHRFDETDALDIDAVLARDESQSALRQLTDDQRAALVQRFVEDRSYEEIASTFGVTQQAARARVSRARRALRRLFDLPSASMLAIGGLARRISARGAVAADAPTPRLGLAAQIVPSIPATTQSTATFATKLVLAATAAVAITVPTAQGSGGTLDTKRPAAVAPAPAVAAPARSEATDTSSVAAPAAGDPAASTTSVVPPSSTESSSSAPAETPSTVVAPLPIPAVSRTDDASSSTASVAPAPEVERGTFDSGSLEITHAGPRYTVHGDATLVGSDGTAVPVTVDGKVLLDESDPANIAIDGTLSMTTDDGRVLRLELNGTATRAQDDSGAVTYTIDANYTLDGSDLANMAHDGSLSGSLTNHDDGTGSFALELEGSSR